VCALFTPACAPPSISTHPTLAGMGFGHRIDADGENQPTSMPAPSGLTKSPAGEMARTVSSGVGMSISTC
jgi:hypothetical protein